MASMLDYVTWEEVEELVGDEYLVTDSAATVMERYNHACLLVSLGERLHWTGNSWYDRQTKEYWGKQWSPVIIIYKSLLKEDELK